MANGTPFNTIVRRYQRISSTCLFVTAENTFEFELPSHRETINIHLQIDVSDKQTAKSDFPACNEYVSSHIANILC